MSLYPLLLERLFHPLHNQIRGRNYAQYRRLLEESQWWDREKLLKFQWQELSRLLDHVFENVPYYRHKYAEAGISRQDIGSLEAFARLPTLSREEIREHREELRAGNVTNLRPHATGGSSGAPTRFYITMDSYDWRLAATNRAYAWSGYRHGELALYLWGAPIGTPPLWKRLKTDLYYAVQRQLIESTFSQNPELWNRIYTLARRKRPICMVGYVSSLEAFARYLRDEGLRMPPLRAVISAAEALSEPTRRELEAAFHAPVFNSYGSREFMSIAVECDRHRGLHINSENILVETAAPASAGPSDILVTDLHNYGMPFLRYQIGDLGTLETGTCACGRESPRIGSIDGRKLDVLRTPDNRVVPGEIFPHLMKDLPEVKEFQVRQVSLNHLILSLVLVEPLSDASRQLLERELTKVFGPAVRIELQLTDSISRLASGKRQVTIGLGS